MDTTELIKHWLHHETQKKIPHGRPEDELDILEETYEITYEIGYRRCAEHILRLIHLWESSPDARQDYIQLMEKGEDTL